jgi:hypothetical protein
MDIRKKNWVKTKSKQVEYTSITKHWDSDLLHAGWPRSQSSSPGWVKNVLFSKSSTLTLEPTQTPTQWVSEALSPGVKRQGREADLSPPTSAEVKKIWIYTSTPHTPSWGSA